MNDTDKTETHLAQIIMPPSNQSSRQTDDAGMNLMEYYYMIRNRPLLFLVFPVVFCIAAIIYVMTVTPQFQAQAQLQMERSGTQVSNIKGVYDPTSGLRDFDTFIQTQLTLIKSREILAKVFDHFNFAETPEYREDADPLSSFSKLVTVRVVPDTFLVNVAFKSPGPQQAADVANYIGDLYVNTYRERKLGISGSGVDKLRTQLEEMRKARTDARQALIVFKETNSLINLNDAQMLLIERMSRIDQALIDAQVHETQLEAMIQAADDWKKRTGNSTLLALPEAMRNAAVTGFKIEKLRAVAHMPELLSKYDKGHRVIKMQAEVINTLDRAVIEEVRLTLAGIRLDYNRAKMRSAKLEEEIRDLERRSLDLDKLSGDYRILEDAYTAAQDSYRMLIKRINEINIAKNADDLKGAGSVEVVGRATPPVLAIFPKKKRTVLLAGFVGLSLGAGLCILLGLMDTSVKCKEEVETLLGRLPALGSIPGFKPDEDQLQAVKDSHSSMAEAFRHVRVSLGLSVLGRKERVFAVTSSQPGEGKTTTAFNLALSLARNNKRVLLLECDMRRPSVHKLLGDMAPERERGVSNVLIGDAELSEITWKFPAVEGMDIAFCGPIPPNPAELLGSDRLSTLLEEAKATYDMVIIDAPPVLNVADTSIITGLGVPLICVVRLFSTSRHQLSRLKEQIDTIQGKAVGTILNHAEAPKQGYYGYYYSGQYYTYSDYSYDAKPKG